MKRRAISYLGTCLAVMLGAVLALSSPAIGEDPTAGAKAAPIPVRMNPDKLAGVDLQAGEPFMAPEAILEGSHRPRGAVLYQGKELIMEIYQDDPATFAITEPFPFDEYVLVLSGKLILTDAGGQVHEYVAGDSLVVPKGFTGTWKMLGNYRELVAIGTEAYENAFGKEEE
ncbi:MAG: DUF861 domain-containing protein [Deltaproteobacteria bacterium]|nr:DUF861 domain-containing protein [Deltaproteobacteria bacterium]